MPCNKQKFKKIYNANATLMPAKFKIGKQWLRNVLNKHLFANKIMSVISLSCTVITTRIIVKMRFNQVQVRYGLESVRFGDGQTHFYSNILVTSNLVLSYKRSCVSIPDSLLEALHKQSD